MSEGFNPAGMSAQATGAQERGPRMIKGLQAEYVPAEWNGENVSGLVPFGHYILVQMDRCAEASAGGIYLTDEMKERMDEASESGCIYGMSEQVFEFDDYGRPWRGAKPKLGDRVYVEKYAGLKARGQDGLLYRLMNRNCIVAGLAADQELSQ